MHQIEIVGMRKNRDLKIVITIIILAIITIILSVGIIIYNKHKVVETATNINNDNNNSVAIENNEEAKNQQAIDENSQKFINEINNIYNSKSWKYLNKMKNIKNKIKPNNNKGE